MSFSQLRFDVIVALLIGHVSPISGAIVTVATNWATSSTRGLAETVTITTRMASRLVVEGVAVVTAATTVVAIVTARSGTVATEGTMKRNSLTTGRITIVRDAAVTKTTGRTTIVRDAAVTKATGRSIIVVVSTTTDRSEIVTTDRSGIAAVVIGSEAAWTDSPIAAMVTSLMPGQGCL